jgi:hypothetical protein
VTIAILFRFVEPSMLELTRSMRGGTPLWMKRFMGLASAAMALAIVGVGCASFHARQVQEASVEKRLTLGTVQREIHKRMSSADVIESLGSPNVVSTDEAGREVWVYDKFATEVVESHGGWSVFGAVGGAGNNAIGGVGAGGGGGASASSQSQRTLTIVIKFDENHAVRDFAYHASRF